MLERWSYDLNFRTAVGIFTGLGVAGLLDQTVVRGADRLPYIPGSTVKGRLRFFASRALESRPKGSGPEALTMHGKAHCKDARSACTLCRLFGNPALRGLLSFSQATLTSPWKELLSEFLEMDRNPVIHADSEIRPGIARSRRRGTALPNHLFFGEAVAPMRFQGHILASPQLTAVEKTFLQGVGRLVDGVGARKAVGRGRLQEGVRIQGGHPETGRSYR